MKPKGNPGDQYHPTPLQEAVNELLDHPRQWAGDGEEPSQEEMVTRFQERLQEATPEHGRKRSKTTPPSYRTAAHWALRAAALLAVFTAGYLAGTRGIREGMADPSAHASAETAGVFTEQVSGDTVTPAVSSEGTILVRLIFEAPEAQSVTVAADWNQWMPETQPLTDEDGDGIWEIHLRLQRGRDYQYQFVIDGSHWVADPEARVQIDDGFGGVNSLLNI